MGGEGCDYWQPEKQSVSRIANRSSDNHDWRQSRQLAKDSQYDDTSAESVISVGSRTDVPLNQKNFVLFFA